MLARFAIFRGGMMPQVRANGIDLEFESFGRSADPCALLIAGIFERLTGWPDSMCHGL